MVKENEFPYNCMDCSAKFKDVQEAKTHFKLVHKEKRLFACTICEKPFTRADTLQLFMRRKDNSNVTTVTKIISQKMV